MPQLGTQTWASLELVDAKLRRTTGKTFKAFEVIKCQDKRIGWDGYDPGSQAIVQAAIKAAGKRGDITAQLEKLLKG